MTDKNSRTHTLLSTIIPKFHLLYFLRARLLGKNDTIVRYLRVASLYSGWSLDFGDGRLCRIVWGSEMGSPHFLTRPRQMTFHQPKPNTCGAT